MAYINTVYCQLNGKVYQSEPRVGSAFCTGCDIHGKKSTNLCNDVSPKQRICIALKIIWKEVIPDESQV